MPQAKLRCSVVTKKSTKKGIYWIYQITDNKEVFTVMSKNPKYEIGKTYDFDVSFSVPTYFEVEK